MKIGITFDLKTDASGDSQEEFDSPVTIDTIASVLRGLGHDVVLLGDGRDMLERLLADPPEFVFNLAEGHGVSRSREARVPAVLEMLGLGYSASDPLTLAVTLDKDCGKRLVASAGVAVPQSRLIGPHQRDWTIDFPFATFPFPAIVKPNWEGSSKGIRRKCLVESADELADVVESIRGEQGQPILVEEYIDGDEVTVGLLGNEETPEARGLASGLDGVAKPRGESSSPEGLVTLGIMRVVPIEPTRRFVYSLEVKRDFRRLVRYECPPKLPSKELAAVDRAARLAWRVLGCRDVARIDFRRKAGVAYFLEVNPLPGLHPEDSDLVIMAKLAGWSHERLVSTILGAALARHASTLQPDVV